MELAFICLYHLMSECHHAPITKAPTNAPTDFAGLEGNPCFKMLGKSKEALLTLTTYFSSKFEWEASVLLPAKLPGLDQHPELDKLLEKYPKRDNPLEQRML